jgi:hypothetical protein
MDMDMDDNDDDVLLIENPLLLQPSHMSTPAHPSRKSPVAVASTPAAVVQQLPSSSTSHHGGIVELTQPVQNRFSFLLDDGRLYRAAVSLPTASPSVSSVLRGIQHAVPQEVFHELLGYLVEDTAEMNPSDDHGEWAALRSLVLSIVVECVSAKPPAVGAESGSLSDWEKLLQTSLHMKRGAQFPFTALKKPLPVTSAPAPRVLKKWSPAALTALPTMLFAIHLVYEDAKLDMHLLPLLPDLGVLLFEASIHLRWPRYIDYYARELPSAPSIASGVPLRTDGAALPKPLTEAPPSIMHWLSRCIHGDKTVFPRIGGSDTTCIRTRQVCRFYLALFHGSSTADDPTAQWFSHRRATAPGIRLDPSSSHASSASSGQPRLPKINAEGVDIPVGRPVKASDADRVHCLVTALAEELISPAELDFLPHGVVLPIREALHFARKAPPLAWNAKCFSFVGRDDLTLQNESIRTLAKAKSYVEHRPGESDDALESVSFRNKTAPQAPGVAAQARAAAAGASATGTGPSIRQQMEDGTEIFNSTSLLRFAKDDRLVQVGRLLRSTKYVPVKVDEVLPEKDLLGTLLVISCSIDASF